MSEDLFETWAVVEMMGHRRVIGKVSETTIAGAGMLRVLVYEGDAEEPVAEQLLPPSSLYCLTPVPETVARKLGRRPMISARLLLDHNPADSWDGEELEPEDEDEKPDSADIAAYAAAEPISDPAFAEEVEQWDL